MFPSSNRYDLNQNAIEYIKVFRIIHFSHVFFFYLTPLTTLNFNFPISTTHFIWSSPSFQAVTTMFAGFPIRPLWYCSRCCELQLRVPLRTERHGPHCWKCFQLLALLGNCPQLERIISFLVLLLQTHITGGCRTPWLWSGMFLMSSPRLCIPCGLSRCF